MIPNIGPMEIAIILVLLLVIFGPRKLPELGRSAGKGIREFKSGLSSQHDSVGEGSPAQVEAEVEKAAEPTKADAV